MSAFGHAVLFFARPQTGQILSDDLLVEKQQGVQRLTMGGGRDLPFIGQHREEGFNLRLSHVLGMAHGTVASMPTDEKPSPIKVGLLSLETIVKVSNSLTELVKQPH